MNLILATAAILALVYRAWSRNSLTPLGIFTATLTAIAHAVHPWSVFFALLVVFFLSGTAVTKVKHDVKARLTYSASGSPAEKPRTHVQVLANSIVASVLILVHSFRLSRSAAERWSTAECWKAGSDPIVVGIIANYAAVAADTFSSELGILSKTRPRLVTNPFRSVAPGTNGGVTVTGLLAGLLGSFIISLTAVTLLPFCSPRDTAIPGFGGKGWSWEAKTRLLLGLTSLGLCGSVLDSLLGALLQASVVDERTGKIIEGDGGTKVKVHSGELRRRRHQAHGSSGSESRGPEIRIQGPDFISVEQDQKDRQSRPSRRIVSGRDLLDNNGVNFVMALAMSITGVVAASWLWKVPIV